MSDQDPGGDAEKPKHACDVQRPVWPRILRRVLVFAAVLYAGWCAVLFFAQDAMIYPRHMIGPAPSADQRPADAESVWITAEGGARVEAWFVRGEGRSAESPGACVVWLHGNGEIIDHNMQAARMYARMGVSVLLPEYRGYGRSGGAPGQRAILGDLERFVEFAAQRPEVDAARIVYHGESLGTGFAAELATKRPPRAMILNSPFLSMRAMAGRFLVPGFLVRTPLRSDVVLRGAAWPVLVFHGRHDEVVPFEQGRSLAALTPGAEFVELECGHNDLPPSWGEYAARVRDFLVRSGVVGGE